MLMLWLFGYSLHWFSYFSMEVGPPPSTFQIIIMRYVTPIAIIAMATFGQAYLSFKQGFDQISNSDYVRTSRVRGLGGGIIMSQYVLRNTVLRMLSSSAMIISALISADILVEATFGYQGLGGIIVDGVLARDPTLLEASLFYFVILAVALSLCCDLIRLKLDPRLRHGEDVESDGFGEQPAAYADIMQSLGT
ncbi:MAG: ABC transporter permease subunit [Nitrososphaerales archaeon]